MFPTLVAAVALSVPNPILPNPESSPDGTWVLRPSGALRYVIYRGHGHYKLWVNNSSTEVDFTVKTDPKQQHIDITLLDGPLKGKTLLGMYRRDGKTLMLIFSKTKRPISFSARDNPDSTYLLLTKE
jgi:hypothetical protein